MYRYYGDKAYPISRVTFLRCIALSRDSDFTVKTFGI